jgi:hypothetical protein
MNQKKDDPKSRTILNRNSTKISEVDLNLNRRKSIIKRKSEIDIGK